MVSLISQTTISLSKLEPMGRWWPKDTNNFLSTLRQPRFPISDVIHLETRLQCFMWSVFRLRKKFGIDDIDQFCWRLRHCDFVLHKSSFSFKDPQFLCILLESMCFYVLYVFPSSKLKVVLKKPIANESMARLNAPNHWSTSSWFWIELEKFQHRLLGIPRKVCSNRKSWQIDFRILMSVSYSQKRQPDFSNKALLHEQATHGHDNVVLVGWTCIVQLYSQCAIMQLNPMVGQHCK